MRWIWIDRILELDKAERCVAVKNVSLAEDHLHDHFPADPETDRPATPVMPGTLMIEGMAQTAGILVGHARDFTEKVILAKIGRSGFDRDVFPGQTLIYTAGGSTAASPPRSSSPPARSSASPSSPASSTPPIPITRSTAPLPG